MRVPRAYGWLSGNVTFWEEYSDLAFVVANSAILLTTISVGIAANAFVMLAVCGQKSLQTSTNALVVNLAVVDVLRCLIDCPTLLTIVIAAHQRGRAGQLLCDAQVASFSFGCCIQLLTLACISAERYQAIAQPFKTTQRRRRITVLIPATWILAIVVAAFCLVFVRDSPVHMRCEGLRGQRSQDTFGLYILFPLWAACFAVIIGFYARIFLLVRSHNRKIFDKGVHPSRSDRAHARQVNGEAAGGRDESVQKQTLEESGGQVGPAQTNSCVRDSPAELVTSEEAPRRGPDSKNHPTKTLEVTDLEEQHPLAQMSAQRPGRTLKTEGLVSPNEKVEAPQPKDDAVVGDESPSTKLQKVSSLPHAGERSKVGGQADKTPSDMSERSPRAPSSALSPNPGSAFPTGGTKEQCSGEPRPAPPAEPPPPRTEAPEPNVDTEGPVCMMPSKERRERASKSKESKMAKRAGYIIVTFLVFWLPLIAAILANVTAQGSGGPQNKVIQELKILSVSVACITSLSDPIIYAAVNPQFRTEFYKLKSRLGSIFKKK